MNGPEKNFTSFLQDGLIKPESFNKGIFDRMYENALESLEVAHSVKDISFLWTIVTSYYAMFYIASAFVYKKGYRTTGKIVHKVIHDALLVLSKEELEQKFIEEYEAEREKALELAGVLLDHFGHEKRKRSQFQYEMTRELKRAKAQTSLGRAKQFVDVFRTLT